MHETLIQRIQRVRRLLAKGSIAHGELDAVLAEVESVLSQPAQDPIANAFKTLSYTEMQGMAAVLVALPNEDGGLLVASKIADREGITRSVIVNALRKLESAGLLQARSLGMKGTNVRLLNGLTVRTLLDRIERFKSRAA